MMKGGKPVYKRKSGWCRPLFFRYDTLTLPPSELEAGFQSGRHLLSGQILESRSIGAQVCDQDLVRGLERWYETTLFGPQMLRFWLR